VHPVLLATATAANRLRNDARFDQTLALFDGKNMKGFAMAHGHQPNALGRAAKARGWVIVGSGKTQRWVRPEGSR
jgi:hypothetical protein